MSSTAPIITSYQWVGFWPDEDETHGLYAELQRELPPGHILHNVPVITFATRRGIDDVLFQHRDEPDRFTVIHLSWLGSTEINAQHPTVAFDGSFPEFLAEDERITAFSERRRRDVTPPEELDMQVPERQGSVGFQLFTVIAPLRQRLVR